MNSEKPTPEQFGLKNNTWPTIDDRDKYYQAMKKYHERQLRICKDDIVQQAVRVRKLQTEYFKFKSAHTLNQCKNAEAKLDQLLSEHGKLELLVNAKNLPT